MNHPNSGQSEAVFRKLQLQFTADANSISSKDLLLAKRAVKKDDSRLLERKDQILWILKSRNDSSNQKIERRWCTPSNVTGDRRIMHRKPQNLHSTVTTKPQSNRSSESQIESERGVADAGRTVTSDLDRMWRYLYPEFDLFVKKRIFYRSDRSGCRREKRNGATSQSDQTMGWSGRREWLRQDVQDTFIEKDEVYQIVLSRTALCRRKRNVERGSGKGSRRHTRSIDGSLCRREKIS